ncbi:MAG: YezD family protein [Clostridiales Family XIII bacterium]|jgi:hypothetical protein|nr:YezD family protein [Clostridiales Family XIII bacterium]
MTNANTVKTEESRLLKKFSLDDLDKIVGYINEIKYGSVTIIIQDGHIIQIDKNEKIRLK